jgi:hypothetical protein
MLNEKAMQKEENGILNAEYSLSSWSRREAVPWRVDDMEMILVYALTKVLQERNEGSGKPKVSLAGTNRHIWKYLFVGISEKFMKQGCIKTKYCSYLQVSYTSFHYRYNKKYHKHQDDHPSELDSTLILNPN